MLRKHVKSCSTRRKAQLARCLHHWWLWWVVVGSCSTFRFLFFLGERVDHFSYIIGCLTIIFIDQFFWKIHTFFFYRSDGTFTFLRLLSHSSPCCMSAGQDGSRREVNLIPNAQIDDQLFNQLADKKVPRNYEWLTSDPSVQKMGNMGMWNISDFLTISYKPRCVLGGIFRGLVGCVCGWLTFAIEVPQGSFSIFWLRGMIPKVTMAFRKPWSWLKDCWWWGCCAWLNDDLHSQILSGGVRWRSKFI